MFKNIIDSCYFSSSWNEISISFD